MKLRFVAAIAALLAVAFPAAAQNLQCGKTFGLQVATCQKALVNRAFPPHVRSAAHKVCVSEARTIKQQCELGTGPCIEQCETERARFIAFCNSEFDGSECGGDPVCQAIQDQIRAGCIATAENNYQICAAACGS